MLGFVLLQSSGEATAEGSQMFNNMLAWLVSHAISFAGKILVAVIIYIVGAWIISFVRKFVKRLLGRRNIDGAVATFINSLTNMLLKVLLAIIIISVLGIPTVSFAAIIASAGLAVGLAMKDNLSNFAGGVMILLNKPFHLNDSIVAQGQSGVVKEIGILYTVLLTADGKTVYIPNGPLSTGSIVNLSNEKNRRVDLVFNIGYGNNADDIVKIIRDVVESDPLVLKDPAVFVGVTAVYNGNFDVTVRAWGANADNSKISVALNESIYRTLKEKGVFLAPVTTVKMA